MLARLDNALLHSFCCFAAQLSSLLTHRLQCLLVSLPLPGADEQLVDLWLTTVGFARLLLLLAFHVPSSIGPFLCADEQLVDLWLAMVDLLHAKGILDVRCLSPVLHLPQTSSWWTCGSPPWACWPARCARMRRSRCATTPSWCSGEHGLSYALAAMAFLHRAVSLVLQG